jgi:diguanylate cyclase (GGDEF)-like protein
LRTSTETGIDILEQVSGEDPMGILATEIAKAAESDRSVSIALVDLDDFARVNDKHGTDVGDEVLRLTTRQLSELGVEGQLLFRHTFRAGGDEFVILMPGVEKENAFLALERERAAFAGEHELAAGGCELSIQVTFSAAVATYPEDGTRPQDVMRKASDALYRAKSTGRNKVCLAKEERMVTKTSHYTQAQLARLSLLAKKEGVGEAVLLREALDEMLRKYGA